MTQRVCQRHREAVAVSGTRRGADPQGRMAKAIRAFATASVAAATACGGGGSGGGEPAKPANATPVAEARAAQQVTTAKLVTLDGKASVDSNGDPLTYRWALLSKPAASKASLGGEASAAPTLAPDMPGTYVASLVVNDGKVDSEAATVAVTIVRDEGPTGFSALPDALYRRITLGTLPPTATNETILAREESVRDWLRSVGGDAWYRNYVDGFAMPPVAEKLYVAERDDLDAPQLGLYYVHHPADSADTLTAYPCAPGSATSSVTIRGLCALADWNAYTLSGETRYRTAFVERARWFLQDHQGGRWLWTVDVPARGLQAPWISGLSQSLGLSVMLRAYQATGDAAFMDAARQAFSWIVKPLEQGGLSSPTAHGTWIEEYPDVGNPSHVFNGHLWALFGVWDFYRVTRDPDALALFRSGTDAIRAEKDRYDLGYWVTYDRADRTDMVTGMYMQSMVQQLYALGAITGDASFTDIGTRWEDYQNTDALFVNMAVAEYLRSRPR